MSLISVAGLRPLQDDEREGRNATARSTSLTLSHRRDRRRNPDGPKTQIRELRSRHQAILRLDLAGLTQREIAPIVGLTPQMVCVVQNSDIYQSERSRLQGRLTEDSLTDLRAASKKLERLCGPSVDTIEQVLLDHSAPPRVRVDAAFSVLDRNGLRPPERHEHVHSYDSVLLDAYRRRREAAVATSVVEEAQPGYPGRGPDDEEDDEDEDEEAPSEPEPGGEGKQV